MPIFILLSVILPFVVLFVTDSFATFGLSIMILLMLSLISFLLKGEKFRYIYTTMLCTYSIYMLFAILHYFQFIDNEIDPNADELRYFVPFVDNIIDKNVAFTDLLYESLSYNRGEHYSYLFYIGGVALFSEKYLGGYNLMQVILSSQFLACIYSIFIFKIISIYIKEDVAVKCTLFYMLCTPIVMYSVSVLRDLPIALSYLIGLIVILKNTKFKSGICILLILSSLIMSLRLEHGLFFVLLILIYIYIKLNRFKILFGVIAIVCVVGFIAIIQNTFITLLDTVSTFNEYTKEHANSTGLAMKLISLPSPIKEVACSLFSQIFPIPPWAGFIDGVKSFPDFIFSFFSMIKTVCWFYIIFFVVKNIFKYYDSIRPYNWGYLMLVALLLIVACSSEYYESRRIMCMYPIIYLVFIKMRDYIDRVQLRKTNKQFGLLYGGLLLAYVLFLN